MIKINHIIFLCFFIFVKNLSAQNKTNSDQYFNENISTLEKVEVLLDSCKNNLRVDNDKALFFAQEALKYAKKANSWESILNAHRNIGQAHRFSNNRDDAHLAYDRAIKLAQKHKDEESAARIFKLKAHLFASESDFGTAIDLYKLTEQYAAENNDTSLLADSYLDIGVIYARQGKFYVAVEYFFKSLELYEAVGNKKYIIPILNNIGSIYQDNKEYDKALIYLNKAKKRFDKEGGQDHFLIHLLTNLGTTHKNLEDYDKAIEYYNLALDKSKEIEDDYFVARTESSIAQLYLEEGKYEGALSFSEKALVTFEEGNYQQEVASCAIRLAIIYRNRKNYLVALKYAKQAHEINLSINRLSGLVSSYQELALINKEIGNSDIAFEYLEQYVEIRDSVFDIDKAEEFVQLEAKYNYEQEELLLTSEINLLKKDKSLQQSRQTILILVLISILIALLALFWVFNNNKKKTVLLEKDLENKAIIEKQAKQLQVFNTQLEETVIKRTAALEQANYELRTFNYIASHDIKEPIRNIGNYAGFVFKKLPSDLKISLGEYFEMISQSTSQLYTLIEDFARYTSLSRNGDIELQSVDLNALVDGIEKGLYYSINECNGKLINNGLPTLISSNSLLYITLKNLIVNGLKYNDSKSPTVELTYNQTATHHEIIVSDNGIGIAKKYHERVFEMFKRLHNRTEYEGSGIGLAIVKLGVDKLKGKIAIDSEEGRGSSFTISLPLE